MQSERMHLLFNGRDKNWSNLYGMKCIIVFFRFFMEITKLMLKQGENQVQQISHFKYSQVSQNKLEYLTLRLITRISAVNLSGNFFFCDNLYGYFNREWEEQGKIVIGIKSLKIAMNNESLLHLPSLLNSMIN